MIAVLLGIAMVGLGWLGMAMSGTAVSASCFLAVLSLFLPSILVSLGVSSFFGMIAYAVMFVGCGVVSLLVMLTGVMILEANR